VRKIFFGISIIILLFLSGCASSVESKTTEVQNVFTFGNVSVNREKLEIRFSATVKKNEGWVQHLLYLHGYQWLEEQSAIVSDARLPELQHGFAMLDWEMWDELWQGIDSEKAFDVKVYIEYEGQQFRANTFIDTVDEIHIGDMIFLGCPYFDSVALGTTAEVDCVLCPVFPLEQEALQERFVRENGESGYNINIHKMFDTGSRIEVIIKLPQR